MQPRDADPLIFTTKYTKDTKSGLPEYPVIQPRHRPRLRSIAGAIGERPLLKNRPLGDSISG